MDFAGLIGKFPTHRQLTDQERVHHLHPQQRLDLAPHYQLGVIRMNSTYLELVDKWYGSKGLLTTIGFAILAIAIGVLGLPLIGGVWDGVAGAPVAGDDQASSMLLSDIGMLLLLVLPTSWAAVWLSRKESFAYTHYPVRFNRKTRMVYVFRTNGTVLSIPWDRVFFTLAQVDHLSNYWNIIGHVMAADGTTVTESFALSISEMGAPDGVLVMRSHWEFVRRYMEDGPASLTDQVQFCLPINRRRESWSLGAQRLLANSSNSPLWMLPITIFSMAVDLLTVPFRYFAMRTSKVPTWPADVEATCAIDDDDPYAIEGDERGNRIAVFPEAARMAGVGFVAPPASPLVQQHDSPGIERPVKGAVSRKRRRK
jgi:hypothetical protein